jgi:hypothetical protein
MRLRQAIKIEKATNEGRSFHKPAARLRACATVRRHERRIDRALAEIIGVATGIDMKDPLAVAALSFHWRVASFAESHGIKGTDILDASGRLK